MTIAHPKSTPAPTAPQTPAVPTGPDVSGSAAPLVAEGLSLGYGSGLIIDGLHLEIRPGSFTVVIGPNGCGKSTLLRGLGRLLPPRAGRVLLGGRDLHKLAPKEAAREISVLAQSSIAPDGITVANLVARGRFPHQGLFQQWTEADERAIHDALTATGTLDLSAQRVNALSGGQQQRVWVAVALAQQTPIMLLDEPTTYLDVAHQVELMELFTDLQHAGRTMVAVLHDINQAIRYATDLVVMHEGRVVACGNPSEIVTAQLISDVFALDCSVFPDPLTGLPMMLPAKRER
ncbi:ABC transporter ATP-binding protein [Nonomuraea sp. NPDC059023]|uniref:ABC transporter ATP-binding protein n=1 Tax=unclassified Nonomuraea TaxID=2593643 RepID=UPI00367FFA9B